jgi:hypothetical protein
VKQPAVCTGRAARALSRGDAFMNSIKDQAAPELLPSHLLYQNGETGGCVDIKGRRKK